MSNRSEDGDSLIQSILAGNPSLPEAGMVLGVSQHSVVASGLTGASIGSIVDVSGAVGVVHALHRQVNGSH